MVVDIVVAADTAVLRYSEQIAAAVADTAVPSEQTAADTVVEQHSADTAAEQLPPVAAVNIVALPEQTAADTAAEQH